MHSIRRLFQLISSVILLASTLTNVTAQHLQTPLVRGDVQVVHSKAIGEARPVFIYTPTGYDSNNNRYPVLYVLDGEGNFSHAVTSVEFLARNGRIPPMIVVGVPNTNRTRDFTPTAMDNRPGSGGGPAFLKFMKRELFPYIEKHYRTQPFRVLAGHSLCGMYALHTMAVEPELFKGIIAMSPALMYDHNAPLNTIRSRLSKPFPYGIRLFVTLGNEPGYVDALNGFITALKEAEAPDVRWIFRQYPEDNHMSVPLKSVYEGLEEIFYDWQVKLDSLDNGLEALKSHYAGISKAYGFTVQPAEAVVNMLGYQYLQSGKAQEAIDVFQFNVDQYPNSANVYDSLGEACEQTGNIQKALDLYRKAAKLAEASGDPNLEIFKEHVRRALKARADLD